MSKDIEKKLNNIKVNEFTAQESDQVWHSIASRLETPEQGFGNILLLKPKFMIGIIMAILLVVGGGLTVQAADSAKPGDFLFPLDQAVEKVQLTIANSDKKQKLKLKFAEERVGELSEIIAEVRDDDQSGSDKSSADDVATSTPMATTTSVSTSTTTTTPAVGQSDDRLEKALSFAIEYLSQVKAELQNSSDVEAVSKLNELLDRLGDDLHNLPPETKSEIKFQSEDGKVEFELETKDKGEQKVELKLKTEEDGSGDREIKIKTREEDNHGSSDSKSDSDGYKSYSGLTEVEVKVYQDSQALVKVKINGEDYQFYLDLSDKEDIIKAIADRYHISEDQVRAVLKIEFESSSDSGSDEIDDDHAAENKGKILGEFNVINPTFDDQSNKTILGDSESDSNTEENPSEVSGLEEVEVEVEGGVAHVKVKIGEEESTFSMLYTDTGAVVDEIVNRFNLPTDAVEQVMKIEIKQ